MDLNRRYSDNEPCWLIKVDTKISGPWSFNEVLVKLTQGEIQAFHEAQAPNDRWRPLQSHPLFAAAMEKLKKQNQVQQDTITRTERTSFTRTIEVSGDRPLPTLSNETVTPPPEVPVQPIKAPTPPPATASYTAEDFYQTSKPAKSSNLWVLLGIVGLLAVGAFYYFTPTQKNSRVAPKNDFLSYFDQGLVLKKKGDWSGALQNFKKAYQLNPKDVDLVFEMSPLLIQLENQTMYARNMMEKIMLGQYRRENISTGKNILALSHSYEGQQSLAIKLYSEVLEGDETYSPAMINKGWALFAEGRFSEAEPPLRSAMSIPSFGVIPYLYLVENFIFEGVRQNKTPSFEKAYQLSSQVANKFHDGQQELLLLQAFAALKLNKGSNTVQSLLQKSLSIDPDMTMEHSHPPLVDWRGFRWDSFSFVCNGFSRDISSDLNSLLEFVCVYKTRNELAAQQAVSGWMGRSPNSHWPHVAQALVLLRLGDVDKAKMSLEMAKKMGAKDGLYYQTLAKTCIRLRDVNCLKSNWDPISKLAPLHAFTAKAIEAKLSGGDARSWVQKGLKESPNYIPLLQMQ